MSTEFKEFDEYPAPNPCLDETRNWPKEVVDKDQHIQVWADFWFKEHYEPSAKGGWSNDEDDYVHRRLGLRVCRTCGATVMPYGADDVEELNLHRRWHDKIGA